MNGRQKTVLALSCAAFVTVLLFPPYFGMDSSSQVRVHAPVGYHPVWAPPAQEYVHRIFVDRGLIPENGPAPSALDVRRNDIRLAFNVSVLALLTCLALLTVKTRKRQERAAPM
jgi:hypothetical protein